MSRLRIADKLSRVIWMFPIQNTKGVAFARLRWATSAEKVHGRRNYAQVL